MEERTAAMTEITPDECRELAERLGYFWHSPFEKWHDICTCGELFTKSHALDLNPNFLDPVVVLREAVKMEKWPEFADIIGCTWYDKGGSTWGDDISGRGDEKCEEDTPHYTCNVDYILNTTGKLAKALLDWLRKEQGHV